MNRRLWSFELSAVMTFGMRGILTLTSGITWKERGRLISENQRLSGELTRARMAELCQLAAAANGSDSR